MQLYQAYWTANCWGGSCAGWGAWAGHQSRLNGSKVFSLIWPQFDYFNSEAHETAVYACPILVYTKRSKSRKCTPLSISNDPRDMITTSSKTSLNRTDRHRMRLFTQAQSEHFFCYFRHKQWQHCTDLWPHVKLRCFIKKKSSSL